MGCGSGVWSKAAPPPVSTSATHSSPAPDTTHNGDFISPFPTAPEPMSMVPPLFCCRHPDFAHYCTYLFMSLVVGQVIGSGIVVVPGTRVSSASHQQCLDDGGVARGGGLVERSSVVLSCSVHLSPSVEIGRNDATRLTFCIGMLM